MVAKGKSFLTVLPLPLDKKSREEKSSTLTRDLRTDPSNTWARKPLGHTLFLIFFSFN
jgi:hypothetical protein